MKTKLILSSIIVVLLAVIGLMIGFNWDIVKARFKKEEVYTSQEVLQKITKEELMSNTWEIESVDEGHYTKMTFKFLDKDVEFSYIYDKKTENDTFTYNILDGIVYFCFDKSINGLLLKENNEIKFFDSENLYTLTPKTI